MAIEKIRLGTNEDGSPHFLYRCPDGHLVYTGPNITGTVTAADGTEHDVSDLYTEVSSPAEALALADAVGEYFVENGHPAHDADVPFVATPTDLTHNSDGTAKEEFVEAVEDHIGPDKNSAPQAIIDALTATPPSTTPASTPAPRTPAPDSEV